MIKAITAMLRGTTNKGLKNSAVEKRVIKLNKIFLFIDKVYYNTNVSQGGVYVS